MSGYTRFWTCEGCGSREQSIDVPTAPLCDSCDAKRFAHEPQATVAEIRAEILTAVDRLVARAMFGLAPEDKTTSNRETR